ncbi:MAG: 16S rRNA (uracil(1498)-N(3))-methyltransferase [Alphaproteobacteria bacterium]|nr:MAG: 16S rRNA (uracil(1498)-N(3))-methyltransferase [Alphaproteobacteria bacterium]
MIRIYAKDLLTLSKEQKHYLKNVMRLKKGDIFRVFNETGEFEMEMETYICGRKMREFQTPPTKALAFVLIKPNRLSFLIEKAVELGATHLYPLTSQHCQFSHFKHERYEKIITESVEQCGRMDIPALAPLQTLKHFIESVGRHHEVCNADRGDPKWMAACSASARHDNTLCIPWFFGDFEGQNTTSNKEYGIIIGPEGGFSKEEIQMLRIYTTGIKLHENILRAETAALKGLTL